MFNPTKLLATIAIALSAGIVMESVGWPAGAVVFGLFTGWSLITVVSLIDDKEQRERENDE